MKKFFLLNAFLIAAMNISAQSFYEFYFRTNGVRYDALMYLDVYENVSIRVKYYDANYGRYLVVDEGCSTTTGPRGVAILCSTVVWGDSNINASSYYAPDNFFLGYDAYGNKMMFNLDNNGAYSNVYGFRQLSTYDDFLEALKRYTVN